MDRGKGFKTIFGERSVMWGECRIRTVKGVKEVMPGLVVNPASLHSLHTEKEHFTTVSFSNGNDQRIL